MGSRITQIQAFWRELDALKHARNGDNTLDLKSAIPELTSSAFEQMPKIQLIGLCSRPETPVVTENKAQACNLGFERIEPNVHLPSTPPKFQSDPREKSSSSTVDLPELPKHLLDDDGSESETPSPKSSPEASEGKSAERGINVRKLRKKASKRFSQMAINLSEIGKKMSDWGDLSSPKKASPTKKSSPRKDDPRLSPLPLTERNRIAVEMARYCLTDDYASAGSTRQSLLFNGKLIGLLDAHSDLVHPSTLTALREDLAWRMQNALVNTNVDLNDPNFSHFVKSAADANFMKPWKHDSADTSDSATGKKKKNIDRLRPTFVRDFDNSEYFSKSPTGDLVKISDTDQFINFIDSGGATGLSHVVSNVASQNLGNFLKNVLFLRSDIRGESQSLLKLHDGTPVMPLAVVKASYVFSKDVDGSITLDYTWNSSNETNGGKTMRVKRMNGDNLQAEIEYATLSIETRIKFSPDGQWSIDNPRLRAEGWNVPAGH